jgi:hypothetical protein
MLKMNFFTASRYGLFIQMPTMGFVTGNQLATTMLKYRTNVMTVASISIPVNFIAIISANITRALTEYRQGDKAF